MKQETKWILGAGLAAGAALWFFGRGDGDTPALASGPTQSRLHDAENLRTARAILDAVIDTARRVSEGDPEVPESALIREAPPEFLIKRLAGLMSPEKLKELSQRDSRFEISGEFLASAYEWVPDYVRHWSFRFPLSPLNTGDYLGTVKMNAMAFIDDIDTLVDEAAQGRELSDEEDEDLYLSALKSVIRREGVPVMVELRYCTYDEDVEMVNMAYGARSEPAQIALRDSYAAKGLKEFGELGPDRIQDAADTIYRMLQEECVHSVALHELIHAIDFQRIGERMADDVAYTSGLENVVTYSNDPLETNARFLSTVGAATEHILRTIANTTDVYADEGEAWLYMIWSGEFPDPVKVLYSYLEQVFLMDPTVSPFFRYYTPRNKRKTMLRIYAAAKLILDVGEARIDELGIRRPSSPA